MISLGKMKMNSLSRSDCIPFYTSLAIHSLQCTHEWNSDHYLSKNEDLSDPNCKGREWVDLHMVTQSSKSSSQEAEEGESYV